MALLLAEIALRLMARYCPDRLFGELDDTYWEREFLRTHEGGDFVLGGVHLPHPTRGWAPAPNCSTAWMGTIHTTNDRGHRSAQPYASQPEKYTVVVLGDSFSFGTEAPDPDVWPTILARQDPRLHVINLAVSGYGTDQMCVTLEETIDEYRPNLVVFAYIDDDLLRPFLSFRDYRKPRFVWDGARLRLTNTPIGSTRETLGSLKRSHGFPHLMLPRVLRQRLDVITPGKSAIFRMNERILLRAVACGQRHGAEFMLVHLAWGPPIFDPACDDLGEEFLIDFVRSHDVPHLRTRPAFLETDGPWDPGHYQRREAALVAGLVHEKILAMESWHTFQTARGPSSGSEPGNSERETTGSP